MFNIRIRVIYINQDQCSGFQIHCHTEAHLGIAKCKQRAREVMYWPTMNSEIDQIVSNCSVCAEKQNQQPAEPLKPTPTPDLPYNMVGCDMFEFESKKHLILVDYYSKYIDVMELRSESTTAVIKAMKTIFACHGIHLITDLSLVLHS